MGTQNKSTPHQPGSDDSANQSVLGEEDPGAAVDTMPWLAGDTPGADGTLNACGASDAGPERDKLDRSKQLQKAISRWENEGGADGDHASKSAKSAEVQKRLI